MITNRDLLLMYSDIKSKKENDSTQKIKKRYHLRIMDLLLYYDVKSFLTKRIV